MFIAGADLQSGPMVSLGPICKIAPALRDDVVIIMGAGNVTELANRLVEKS